jgi:hypothetical protein
VRRLALVAAAGLAVGACRTPLPRLEPLPSGDPRPAALLAAWTQGAEARRGLRGRARMAVDSEDGNVHLRARQILVLERPARLRVEVLGLLGQTRAVLVTDGDRFELFDTQDRSYRTGEVTPALLWEQVHLALSPAEAVDLLLGAPAPAGDLHPVAAFSDGEGGVRVDLADAAGAVRRRAGFDARGRLEWVEALDHRERRLWRAEFRDYAPVEGVDFAHAVALEVAAGDTRAEISLSDVELNPELPPDIFRLRAPALGAGGSRRDG